MGGGRGKEKAQVYSLGLGINYGINCGKGKPVSIRIDKKPTPGKLRGVIYCDWGGRDGVAACVKVKAHGLGESLKSVVSPIVWVS